MGCEISRVIGRHFSRKTKVGVINEDSELAKRMMGPAVNETNSEDTSDVKEADTQNKFQHTDRDEKTEEYDLPKEEGVKPAVVYAVKPADISSCFDNTGVNAEKTETFGNDVPVRVQRVRPKAAKGPRAMPRSSASYVHWSRHLFAEEPPECSLDAALGDCSPFLDKRRRPKAAKGCRTPMWVESSGFEGSSLSRQLNFSNGDPSLWDNRLKEKSDQQRALDAWSKRVQERE